MQNDDAPTLAQRIGRFYQTLRYYRTSQLARRGWKLLTDKWLKATGLIRRPPDRGDLRVRESTPLDELIESRIAVRQTDALDDKIEALRGGRFSFLNVELNLGRDVDWRAGGYSEASHLWRFQLHYHDFLLDFIAAHDLSGDDSLMDDAWQLVDHWIRQHPFGDAQFFDDAWHAYCISRRLPIWMMLWHHLTREGAAGQRVLDSIFQQTWYLGRNLELDVRGNHLLENARALLMAGCFFEGDDSSAWLAQGESILRHELKQQILPSGEHFERSPMYHVQILEILLDVAACCRELNPTLATICDDAAGRMAEFLPHILHPDRDIPLLGDSCFGETSPTIVVIDRARSHRHVEQISPTATSDYWTFRDGGDFLLFDGGRVGADHLPAHAHCDLLNIEASIDGRRFLVDSGVHGYEDDDMRRYCRSTAAHNVVEIDGTNQCDIWSRFRMGYRGWPSEVKHGSEAGFQWASCGHNAYRRLGIPTVTRWIACRAGGPWFIVDSVHGKGDHRLASRLHLHPDCQAQQIDPRTVSIQLHPRTIRVRSLAIGELAIGEGWYCPKFGLREAAPVLVWTATSEMPIATGWEIAWGKENGLSQLLIGEDGQVRLAWQNDSEEIELHPGLE